MLCWVFVILLTCKRDVAVLMKRARRLVMIIGGDGYAAAREIEAYGESYG